MRGTATYTNEPGKCYVMSQTSSTMNHVLSIILAILLSSLPLTSSAQEDTGSDTWQDIYNALSDLDDLDEEGWNEAYEVFTALSQSPQNINEATLSDLQQIPLLSEQQALAILHYRSLYGDLHSISELYLITALDRPRIQILKSVFYATPLPKKKYDITHGAGITPGDSAVREYRKYIRTYYHGSTGDLGSLLFTMKMPTYERKGYQDGTYRGYDLNHSLRYRYVKNNLQIGLTAAQDAGEPFFAGTNGKGWDFYTGFVRVKKKGVMQNLVVGHYKMSVGMGLLMNTDFRLSRASLLLASPKTSVTLRGHSSRQENNYLQGIAGTLLFPIKGKTRSLAVTPFISYRAIDATMSNTEPQTITTILTTGYHRTNSEIARRNTASQFAAGTSIVLNLIPFSVALNILHTSFSDPLIPDKSYKYNIYHPTGKSFTSGSLTYRYIHPRLEFSGETAISGAADSISYNASEHGSNGIAMATANSLRVKLSEEWTVFALQRFYGYRYQSLQGRSFGDMSNCQNETGIYGGVSTTAIPNTTIAAYVDCAYHPWFRYGYDNASRSFDAYVYATYTKKATTATLRYRYRELALAPDGSAFPAFNSIDDGTAQHTLRLSLKHTTNRWTTVSQVQGAYLPSSSDWGYLFSQALGYRLAKRRNVISSLITSSPLSLWCSLTYFDTSGYDARLYLTDQDMAYAMTSQMLYGRGIRANIMLLSAVTENISAALRCHSLRYLDRSTISASHQQIDSSSQTDISLQIQLTF